MHCDHRKTKTTGFSYSWLVTWRWPTESVLRWWSLATGTWHSSGHRGSDSRVKLETQKSEDFGEKERGRETFDCLFDWLTNWLTEAVRSWRASFVLPLGALYLAAAAAVEIRGQEGKNKNHFSTLSPYNAVLCWSLLLAVSRLGALARDRQREREIWWSQMTTKKRQCVVLLGQK